MPVMQSCQWHNAALVLYGMKEDMLECRFLDQSSALPRAGRHGSRFSKGFVPKRVYSVKPFQYCATLTSSDVHCLIEN